MHTKTQAELMRISRSIFGTYFNEFMEIVDTAQYSNTYLVQELVKQCFVNYTDTPQGAELTVKGWRALRRIAAANAELMFRAISHPNTRHLYSKESYVHWCQRWNAYQTLAEMKLGAKS